MDFLLTVTRFFKEGGVFMYPIGIVLAVGLMITLERYLVLNRARRDNQQAFARVIPLLRKRDYQAVINLARDSNTPIIRIVAAGVARLGQAGNRDEIELAMEEGILESLPRLERRTPYLATLANVATLLGLLGTIIGLIAAFTAVAEAGPAEKATLLSSSISVTMNTTAFGLISAIPLLLFHATLQTKTNALVDSLEMTAVKCLNLLTNGGNRPAAKS